ncbi:MAG: CorA family divalent cation transporter [Novosphingobium sp.]
MHQHNAITAVLFDANGDDRAVKPLDHVDDVPDEQIYWLIAVGDSGAALPGVPQDKLTRNSGGGVAVDSHSFSFTVPAAPNSGGFSDDEMTFIVGTNWLVTISDKPLVLTRDYLDNDTGLTLKGSLTAPALAVSLLLAHFGMFHGELTQISEKLDALDDEVFRARQRHDPLVTLAVLRRQAARIRAVVAAHRSVIAALDRPDFSPAVGEEDCAHLQHLAEAYHRLVDTVERTREAVLMSYDLYATRVAQNTNRLLERLTVITIGIGLIGAIGGIFGMNFEFGLFKAGEPPFWSVVSAMAVIALATLAIATRRRV